MSSAVSVRIPKYRHHKAKGLALVTIRGRDVYLGPYDSPESHEAYRRLVAESLQTGAAHSATDEITAAEVMAAYVRFAKTYYRKDGKPTREYGLIVECCRFIRPLYSRTPASQFGPLALKCVRQEMINADHSRKHINKNIERVRRMFRWAAAEELIPASIPQALGMVTGLRQGRSAARETPPVLPVSDEVVNATLPHLPAMVADMVRIQRLTGMRPSEVCRMKGCDIDGSLGVWVYRPPSHKTQHQGRTRDVFLGPKAQQILGPYLDRRGEGYCFCPRDSEALRQAARHAARRTPNSCGNGPGTNRRPKPARSPGDHYVVDAYRRAITRACRKAEVEAWAPNRLRHSLATQVRRDFGLEAAQVMLGHSQASVTQVYAERDLAKGVDVAQKIG